MTNQRACTVGVDIGGTKIAAALVDDDGEIIRSQRYPTPRGGARAVLRAVGDLIVQLTTEHECTAIGVGSPGVVDVTTGVVRSATDILPGWAGAQVSRELTGRFGMPVVVDNDVRVMAHGESRRGAGRGYDHALYVSVGTGIGGALTREGRLVHGDHGSVGEIAHLLVPREGALACGCGRRDHLEAVAAGPAITAEYAARTGQTTVALPEIIDRMRAGDEQARAVVGDAAVLLGRALAGLVTAVDIDAVVVGGGVAEVGADFLAPLNEALEAEVRPSGRAIPLAPAVLGQHAPLVGAALLASDRAATTTAGANR